LVLSRACALDVIGCGWRYIGVCGGVEFGCLLAIIKNIVVAGNRKKYFSSASLDPSLRSG